jgi:hypothetical protein
MLRIILIVIFILGLIYLLYPMPNSINDFAPLPDSRKSDEPGDTYQIPNVVAYFSNYFRPDVTNFYKKDLQRLSGMPFPPLRLNHPPEESFTYIKDQSRSTYLEEFTYPLKATLFVNGFEPFYNSHLTAKNYDEKRPRYLGATDIVIYGKTYDTKTTLRYYPTSIWARIVVWTGIIVSIYFILTLGKRILFKK